MDISRTFQHYSYCPLKLQYEMQDICSWNSCSSMYYCKGINSRGANFTCCFLQDIYSLGKRIDIQLFTSRPFLKTAGGIVLGSVAVSAVSAVSAISAVSAVPAVSAVSAVSADVLPYISVAIKASFLKLGMCNICKNNIAKMFLDF